jgi:hypothetical protein
VVQRDENDCDQVDIDMEKIAKYQQQMRMERHSMAVTNIDLKKCKEKDYAMIIMKNLRSGIISDFEICAYDY